MKRTSKQLISLIVVVLLMASFTIPAFAAESTITPTTGTKTVYMTSKSYGYINFELAYGTKSFSISRGNVKIVSAGTTGIKLQSFQKSNSNYSSTYSYDNGSAWQSDSYSGASCYYYAGFRFSAPGTAKISYIIGSKTYYITLKVLAYRNPVKSITMTGLNSNKSFHSLTSSSNYASKSLTFNSTVKTSICKMTAASGWRISNITVRDNTAGSERNVIRNQSAGGFPGAFVYWGNLLATHSYTISAQLYNTSNNATINVTYPVYGAQA